MCSSDLIKGFLLSMSISYRLVGGLQHRGIRHCLLPAIPSIDRLGIAGGNDEFLPAVHAHCKCLLMAVVMMAALELAIEGLLLFG